MRKSDTSNKRKSLRCLLFSHNILRKNWSKVIYPFITWFSCGVKIILPGFRKMFPCFYCFYLPPLVLVLYHLVVGRDMTESLSLPWNYCCKRWRFNNLPLKPKKGARRSRWPHTSFIVKLRRMAWVVEGKPATTKSYDFFLVFKRWFGGFHHIHILFNRNKRL